MLRRGFQNVQMLQVMYDILRNQYLHISNNQYSQNYQINVEYYTISQGMCPDNVEDTKWQPY